MSTCGFLVFCIQACLILNVFSTCHGAPFAPCGYGAGFATPAAPFGIATVEPCGIASTAPFAMAPGAPFGIAAAAPFGFAALEAPFGFKTGYPGSCGSAFTGPFAYGNNFAAPFAGPFVY